MGVPFEAPGQLADDRAIRRGPFVNATYQPFGGQTVGESGVGSGFGLAAKFGVQRLSGGNGIAVGPWLFGGKRRHWFC